MCCVWCLGVPARLRFLIGGRLDIGHVEKDVPASEDFGEAIVTDARPPSAIGPPVADEDARHVDRLMLHDPV
jgi:hypothetical protein